MAMFVRAANQFSPLFKEKNYSTVHVCVEKIEILQVNKNDAHAGIILLA